MYIYIYEYRYLFTLIYLYMYAEYPSHKFFDYQDAKGDFHQIQNKISHKPNNLCFFSLLNEKPDIPLVRLCSSIGPRSADSDACTAQLGAAGERRSMTSRTD